MGGDQEKGGAARVPCAPCVGSWAKVLGTRPAHGVRGRRTDGSGNKRRDLLKVQCRGLLMVTAAVLHLNFASFEFTLCVCSCMCTAVYRWIMLCCKGSGDRARGARRHSTTPSLCRRLVDRADTYRTAKEVQQLASTGGHGVSYTGRGFNGLITSSLPSSMAASW